MTYTMQHLDRTIAEVMDRLQIADPPGELELYGDARVYLRGKFLDWFRAGQADMRERLQKELACVQPPGWVGQGALRQILTIEDPG